MKLAEMYGNIGNTVKAEQYLDMASKKMAETELAVAEPAVPAVVTAGTNNDGGMSSLEEQMPGLTGVNNTNV